MTDGAEVATGAALSCPLCGYDLRGLPPGRCPECAHGFDPDDLRQAASLRHPYLFEYHARGFWWSVPATLAAACLPGRFWGRLRPAITVRPWRVVGYWLIVVAAVFACWPAVACYEFFSGGGRSRYATLRQVWAGAGQGIAVYEAGDAKLRAALDAIPWANGDFVQSNRSSRRQWVWLTVSKSFGRGFGWISAVWPVAAVVLAWGWAVLLTTGVFRVTLRQARITPGHVLRAALYAGDLAPLLPIGVAVVVCFVFFDDGNALAWRVAAWGRDWPFVWTELALVTPMAIFSGWRLLRAYTLYLRLPHALATVAAVEGIVAFAAVLFLLDVRVALLF